VDRLVGIAWPDAAASLDLVDALTHHPVHISKTKDHTLVGGGRFVDRVGGLS
jgi:hypothetical protein